MKKTILKELMLRHGILDLAKVVDESQVKSSQVKSSQADGGQAAPPTATSSVPVEMGTEGQAAAGSGSIEATAAAVLLPTTPQAAPTAPTAPSPSPASSTNAPTLPSSADVGSHIAPGK